MVEEAKDHGLHFRGTRGPGTRYVENPDVMFLEKSLQETRGGILVFTGDQESGLANFLGVSNGELGAANGRDGGDNQGGVRLLDVESGALRIGHVSCFLQLIAFRDATVLGESTCRTPSAVWNMVSDGPVESRSVGTGLATGHYGKEQGVAVWLGHSEKILSASILIISPNWLSASMSILEESPTMEINLGRG